MFFLFLLLLSHFSFALYARSSFIEIHCHLKGCGGIKSKKPICMYVSGPGVPEAAFS